MGTVVKTHFNNIINDDTMGDWAIKELIDMLEEYLDGADADHIGPGGYAADPSDYKSKEIE